MKRILFVAISVLATVALSAKTTGKITIENGGPGPYKAVVVEDKGLPGYSIIRPDDLKSAAAVEGKLPVILFGNGGCSRDSWGFLNFLTNIASNGYVIITNGKWSAERPVVNMPQQQGGAQPAFDREAMLEQFKKVEAGNKADALDYLRALDWLQKESLSKKSEYFGTVDANNTAAMGQSCGGLQALILGTSGDPRIKTTMPLNSGVTSPGDGLSGMISKDDLQKLPHPICYLIGGKSDIAYPNATDDYKRISHVPVVVANLEVGHGGTYREEYGGSFADMALLWLDYRLKGKEENELIFRYSQVPSNLEGWTMTSKNFSEKKTLGLWNDRPSSDGEEITLNDFGEVEGYRKVTDPTMTVSLPDKDKADGSAVIIFPGGALVSLSWESEFRRIADWLNARGVAAIGVKYRLRSSFPRPAPKAEGEDKPTTQSSKFLAMQGKIYDFVELRNANTSPSEPDPADKSTDNAADDALKAMEIVKQHAAQWNIDPDRIGWMGFSAGGGVELAALMKAKPQQMPAFLCSVYGPSLVDITVPENAPKLFVAVHADHPNVAAGCMALFMEWKKAGIDSEIHVYSPASGGFFGGMVPGSPEQKPTPEGMWLHTFYSWMVANGFAK